MRPKEAGPGGQQRAGELAPDDVGVGQVLPHEKGEPDEADEAPHDDHEALRVRARDGAEAGRVFIPCGPAYAHVPHDPVDLDDAHQQDGQQAREADIAAAGGSQQLEHLRIDPGAQHLDAGLTGRTGRGERVEAERNQQEGERDDQDALEDFVAGGAGQSAHEQVAADNQREPEIELVRLDVGDRRPQALLGIEVPQFLELDPLLGGHRRGIGLLKRAELAELLDLVLLGGRPCAFGFGEQRCRDVVSDEIGPTDEEHDVRHLIKRIDFREVPAVEALLEKLGHGDQAHAAEPHVHEPVIRIHEHRLEGQPGPGNPPLVYQRRGAHRAVGIGGVAEVEEELIELPELPTRQEVALLACRMRQRTLPEVQDGAEIGRDHQQVDDVNSAHRGKNQGDGRRAAEDTRPTFETGRSAGRYPSKIGR